MWRVFAIIYSLLVIPCRAQEFAFGYGTSTYYYHSQQTVCFQDGCVRGKTESGNIHAYDAFYGIPFATPPVGPLRFENPLPPQYWSELRNATYPRSPCVQVDPLTKMYAGSEDCLYLNVYRPQERTLKLLPVLVFIHGGSFKGFSADPNIFGPDYIMDTRELIVVTIQYRLDVLGFLAADDESCKGNFGLKDQNMALRWVNENIARFGGNPERVTLMGQSAGGASVQYQMMSKYSDNLFKRAILMSGSALAFWTIERKPEQKFRKFATLAGIPNANTAPQKEIVYQLKQKSPQELLAYSYLMDNSQLILPVFRPVVERNWDFSFIKSDPEQKWKSGNYQLRPFLTGVTGYEQGIFADLYFNKTLSDGIVANYQTFFPQALDTPATALTPLLQFYFNGVPTQQNIENVLRIRDLLFDYPMYKTVDYYTRYANLESRPVDIYRFNFTSKFSIANLIHHFPINERGASHMDDILYVFRFKALDPFFTRLQPENEMKDIFVRYLVNYIRHGYSRLHKVRACRRRDMHHGFCEYLDIQRDYRTTPNEVRLTRSHQFDMKMVQVLKLMDKLAKGYEVYGGF